MKKFTLCVALLVKSFKADPYKGKPFQYIGFDGETPQQIGNVQTDSYCVLSSIKTCSLQNNDISQLCSFEMDFSNCDPISAKTRDCQSEICNKKYLNADESLQQYEIYGQMEGIKFYTEESTRSFGNTNGQSGGRYFIQGILIGMSYNLDGPFSYLQPVLITTSEFQVSALRQQSSAKLEGEIESVISRCEVQKANRHQEIDVQKRAFVAQIDEQTEICQINSQNYKADKDQCESDLSEYWLAFLVSLISNVSLSFILGLLIMLNICQCQCCRKYPVRKAKKPSSSRDSKPKRQSTGQPKKSKSKQENGEIESAQQTLVDDGLKTDRDEGSLKEQPSLGATIDPLGATIDPLGATLDQTKEAQACNKLIDNDKQDMDNII